MSAPRVRYAEAPCYVMHYPTCSACDVDLDWDDGWMCPKCETTWDSHAGDGDPGTLWAEWSGEDFDEDTPVTPEADGWKVPWIEHRFEAWVLGTYDTGKCSKCYQPKSMHVGGAS